MSGDLTSVSASTFVFTSPIYDIEESANSKRLRGVFLKLDSTTGNKRRYSSAEGPQIAKSLRGMPVYYEISKFIDPVTNMIQFKHRKDDEYRIGWVRTAVFDKFNKVIHGMVEIFNTKWFPNILERIKEGFGFSIGGAVERFEETLNSMGEKILTAIGMVANHIQLLEPTTPRGQGAARVTAIEEVLNFMGPEGLVITFEGEILEDEDLINTFKFGGK